MSLHKHTTSFLLLMEECLAVLRQHLVQLWKSVPVALLPISHGVLADQQLTMLHTAPWSPFSTTHTHKTVMSLYLTGHNSRIGLDVVWFMEIIPAISKQQIHRPKPTSLLYVLLLGENYIHVCIYHVCISVVQRKERVKTTSE